MPICYNFGVAMFSQKLRDDADRRRWLVRFIKSHPLMSSREIRSSAYEFGYTDAEVDQATADAFNPYLDSPADSSSQKQKRKFDPLLILALPIVAVNAICSFVLLLLFNLCIAISKTFRGNHVE